MKAKQMKSFKVYSLKVRELVLSPVIKKKSIAYVLNCKLIHLE